MQKLENMDKMDNFSRSYNLPKSIAKIKNLRDQFCSGEYYP